MGRRLLLVGLGLSLLLAACEGAAPEESPGSSEGRSAIVYKDPT